MKRVLLIIILLVSFLALAQEYDELLNTLLSRSEAFVSFSGAGFDARFVPTYAATDSEIKMAQDQNLLGILIVRSTRVMDIEVNSVLIVDAKSNERISPKIYKVEDLSTSLELPFSLPSGGVLVLTSQTPIDEYFLDIRVQQILLPWRVKTAEPGRLVEMAPVTLNETVSASDSEAMDNYDSLVVGIADLNDRLDFLQDNVEGLNLQFRRLNTLFLDTQVALAEYKAMVDQGTFDVQEFALSIENRIAALEESVVDNPVRRIEFEELGDSLDRLYSSLADWSDEISRIETLAASQSRLQELVLGLQNQVVELKETAGKQADSDQVLSIIAKIEEINAGLSAAEKRLEELGESIVTQYDEVVSLRENLGDKIDSLTNRLVIVEESVESDIENLAINTEQLEEVSSELKELSVYVSETALSQMEKVSSVTEILSDVEARLLAAESSLYDIEEIRARLAASESTTRNLSDRMDNLRDTFSSVENTILDLVEKVDNLEVGVFGTGAINMEEVETEILELREIADSLSRGFVRFNSDLITLRESIPPEGVSIEAFEETRSEFTEEITTIYGDLAEFKSSLTELGLSFGLLQDSLETVSVDLDSMKGNFDGSVAAIDSNLKTIKRLQDDLSATEEELMKARKDLSSLSQDLEARVVSREEIIAIAEELVNKSREDTAQEIASLRRTNNIWLTVAVISSLAAIVLGIINILP
ncbi:hypothetical protein [Mesotoga sp. BH458_6_3_2_1]|uniref:hypothetical protein n=1 Tax=Mesotoga sp. BH458_6_3_2_1 TaxID=1437446 RepID=UPI000EF26C36|nr:hypothetical protein [Mesotoga sp. BH458_6_3_2_1]RLL81684.1 hypothetical protein Y697_13235 [Mesotoga sp. BH458_6_3_2_1]